MPISENTYIGKQGTGFATVLGPATLPDEMLKDKRAGLAARKVNPAAKKLREQEVPEHWYRYDVEIQKDYDEMFANGAALMGRSIDPFTAVDPESQAFQKQLSRLGSKADTSDQLKEYYDKQRGMVQGKEGDYEGFQEMEDFFNNNSLTDIMANGLTPPSLTKATPNTDLYPFYKDMVEEGITNNNGIPMSQHDLGNMIDFRLSNPEDAQSLRHTYKAKSQKLDPTEWSAVVRRADLYRGGDWLKQMMMEDAALFNQSPYTIEQMSGDIAKGLKVRTTKIERGAVTTTSGEVSEKTIKNRIRQKLESDPRAWGMVPGSTLAEKVDYFYDKNKDAIRGQVTGRKYERMEDELAQNYGFSKQEITDNFDTWYRQYKKGYKAASDFLVGTKLPGEGLTIYKTDPSPMNKDGSVDEVKVYLRGPDVAKIQLIAQTRGVEINELADLLSDDPSSLPPDIRESISTMISVLGRGTYLEDEGSIIRVYDLNYPNDQELLRANYKEAFKEKKDTYLPVDEKAVDPGGSSLVPMKGPYLPFK